MSDTVNLEDVRHAVDVLKWARQQRANLEAELEHLEAGARAVIEEALGEDGVHGTLDGKPVIEWRRYTTNQFQQKRFREENPHLAEQYTTREERRQFRLVPEGDDKQHG